jgi:hypothetical protein
MPSNGSARPRVAEDTKDEILDLAKRLDQVYEDVEVDGEPPSFNDAVEAVGKIARIHLREEVQFQKMEALEEARKRRVKSAQYQQVQQTQPGAQQPQQGGQQPAQQPQQQPAQQGQQRQQGAQQTGQAGGTSETRTEQDGPTGVFDAENESVF